MTTIVDNAGIFGGKKAIVDPGTKRNFSALLWLINNYREPVYQVLVKYGYTGGNSVPEIIRGVVKMLKQDNENFRNDLAAVAKPGANKSNFDFGIITGAISSIANLFKGNPNTQDNDISDELIQLQIEKQKQKQMNNLIAFGAITLVVMLGTIVIIKASQ